MGHKTVILGGGTTVNVGGPTKRVILDRSTVARIEQHRIVRPATVSTPVRVAAGVPVVNVGAAAGPQGPRGEPGLSGGGTTPPIEFAFGDAPGAVYTPSVDGMLTVVRLQMTTAFNGSGAAIELGTLADPAAAFPANFNDPYSTQEFEVTPDLPLLAGQSLRLTITPGSASQGAGLLFLTFIPTS